MSWQDYFAGKHVWITGAGGGLGSAMTTALAEYGAEIVASDIREDLVSDLAERFSTVHPLALDISNSDLIDEAATRVWDLLGSVDILINNAGISQRSLFAETDRAVLRRIIEINLIGTMEVTRAVVPRMLAGGGGHILTITSMAARVQTPLRSMYAAAKSGLHGMFDCLRGELRAQGIRVTLAVPGTVQTGISKNAMTASGAAYGHTDRNQAAGMAPDECARKILKGAAARRREFTVAMPLKFRFAQFLRRYAPNLFFRMIANAKVSG